jgi:hypothetical protein
MSNPIKTFGYAVFGALSASGLWFIFTGVTPGIIEFLIALTSTYLLMAATVHTFGVE